MKSQKVKKLKTVVPNFYKAALIQFELKKRGFKQQKIADDLNITGAAVYRSLYDLSKSKKIDAWVEENLELKFGS